MFQQVLVGCTCLVMVHDGISQFLDFLDFPFSGILVLVMGFTRKVGDGIHPKDVPNLAPNLNLAIITEEWIGGTNISNKIL